MTKILANDNKLELEDGSFVEYDVLGINVGSKTKNTNDIPGAYEYSLTTRPINDLLGKIEKREKELQDSNTIPKVIVCGAGCAGVELSFGFKNRWTKLFGQEIETTLLSSGDCILPGEKHVLRESMVKRLGMQNIQIETNAKVCEVTPEGVTCADGRKFEGNVVVWSTGAEPQPVIDHSDLEISKGYFRVNEHLQSTSHKNVFAGGDCITITNYEDKPKPFPPKAGVYAVREGPIIAQNIMNYIKGEPLKEYEPQSEFLALLMTGDKKAVGSKFGFTFAGKWVWNMKDFIDVGFMKLFDPHLLFEDYENKGTEIPIDNRELFEDEKKEEQEEKEKLKEEVNSMSSEEAAEKLKAGDDHEEFMQQFLILDRMKSDSEFKEGVIKACT